MMTESVDQSFQSLPNDPNGMRGGKSPLPHEKAMRKQQPNHRDIIAVEQTIGISPDHLSPFNATKGHVVYPRYSPNAVDENSANLQIPNTNEISV